MKLKVRYKPAGYLRVLFFKGFLRFSINEKRLVCAHSKLTQALTQALTHTTPRNSYNSNYKPPSNPGQHEISGRGHTCEPKLQGNSHAFRRGLRRCRVFKFAFAIL